MLKGISETMRERERGIVRGEGREDRITSERRACLDQKVREEGEGREGPVSVERRASGGRNLPVTSIRA